MQLRERTQKRDYAALFEDSQEDGKENANVNVNHPEFHSDEGDDDDSQEYQHTKKKAKRKPRAATATKRQSKKTTKAGSSKARTKKSKAEEAKQPKPYLPYDCIYRIMEYSDSSVCHVFASASSGIRDMLTYDLVIKNALLGLPISNGKGKVDNRFKESKNNINKPLGRLNKVMAGIKDDVMILPTPGRLLSLLNGKSCEMPNCEQPTAIGHIPDALRCGLFTCRACLMSCVISSSYVYAKRFRNEIGPSFRLGDEHVHMRIPFLNSAGERTGPAMSMADVDDIIKGTTTKEEITGDINADKKQEILDTLEAATSQAAEYRKAREGYAKQEHERRQDIKRQQIVEALREQHGEAEWLECILERKPGGSFTSQFMKQTVDVGILRSLNMSVRFTKKTVSNYVEKVVRHVSDMKLNGLHDASFLKNCTTAVEKFWYAKWKAEYDEDKMALLKHAFRLDSRSISGVNFSRFATVVLGGDYLKISIKEALPKEKMTAATNSVIDDDLDLFIKEGNRTQYSYSWNRPPKRCVLTFAYDKMLAKYAKTD